MDGFLRLSIDSLAWKSSSPLWQAERTKAVLEGTVISCETEMPLAGPPPLLILVRGFTLGGAIELQDRVDTDFPDSLGEGGLLWLQWHASGEASHVLRLREILGTACPRGQGERARESPPPGKRGPRPRDPHASPPPAAPATTNSRRFGHLAPWLGVPTAPAKIVIVDSQPRQSLELADFDVAREHGRKEDGRGIPGLYADQLAETWISPNSPAPLPTTGYRRLPTVAPTGRLQRLRLCPQCGRGTLGRVHFLPPSHGTVSLSPDSS